jgi:hypothetical protein
VRACDCAHIAHRTRVGSSMCICFWRCADTAISTSLATTKTPRRTTTTTPTPPTTSMWTIRAACRSVGTATRVGGDRPGTTASTTTRRNDVRAWHASCRVCVSSRLFVAMRLAEQREQERRARAEKCDKRRVSVCVQMLCVCVCARARVCVNYCMNNRRCVVDDNVVIWLVR